MDHIALVSLCARPGSESQTLLDVSVDSTEVDRLDTFDVLAAGIGLRLSLATAPEALPRRDIYGCAVAWANLFFPGGACPAIAPWHPVSWWRPCPRAGAINVLCMSQEQPTFFIRS